MDNDDCDNRSSGVHVSYVERRRLLFLHHARVVEGCEPDGGLVVL